MPTTRRRLIAALAAAPLLPAIARATATRTAWDFEFPSIEGGTIRLADWRGRPVLVVNTASRCGYTYQYEGLQTLWRTYRERGLIVLGVPSDDFGQELASAGAVKTFCHVNFDVDFPMTAILPVTGPKAHPFFAWARDAMGEANAPHWNFHKYLVGPDGRLAAAFDTAVEPDAPRLRQAIEAALGET